MTPRRVRLAVALAALALLPAPLAARKSPEQRIGLTARCYYPGAVVLAWPASRGGAMVFRGVAGHREVQLASLSPGVTHYFDVGVPSGTLLSYRVELADGTELGPAPAADSPEMLVGGDLEDPASGAIERTLAFHPGYGSPRWSMQPVSRPGSRGSRSLRIEARQPPENDGLHSRLLPIDPRASLRQSGWARLLLGSRARLGRQLLTPDLEPTGRKIVAYSYAPLKLEADDGWQQYEQRLSEIPDDVAYVQVWALANKTRDPVWFDDLSLVDERAERLAGFDSVRELAELRTLAAKTGEASAQVDRLAASVARLEAALRQPAGLTLRAYLDAVEELDSSVQRLRELSWDLRILALAR